MGRLTVVGFGPGGYEDMTNRAVKAIKEAEIVIGYTTYIELLKPLFPQKEYLATPMMQEVKRCEIAVELAEEHERIAMVSSGDSGIYGMAGIVMEVAQKNQSDITIDVVPGITAASAAASILGAPLMHDFSVISLSDLMTPLDLIMKRVECAGMSDMIVCLYNPKSKKRKTHVEQAADLLMKYRDETTPVGVVRHAGREEESSYLTTLGELKDMPLDMFCVVIVGNSTTYIANGKMITPRGYEKKYE
ncbi:MAG: precorrin-3B C(17)-methyltransferase [Lachnospiraceae bacterium]|nr:precorrin-3B C(17)-methyltransferase [Lachnospiraceae bacterium]